jgi:hypothetical protein
MIQFISSNGILVVNEKGEVIIKESDLSDWLLTIKKVDIEEIDNYLSLNGFGSCEGGDVLDFGYWDKENVYHTPSKSWRIDTFHNQDFEENKIIEVVSKSFDWLSEKIKERS